MIPPRAWLSNAGVTRGDSVIELHNVTSRLPDQRLLFENVNISLLSSTVVGVVGPNGAGKSTFLKVGSFLST
jgi:ABC-type Mn2+/Zn2+ transport system ATPase subunit